MTEALIVEAAELPARVPVDEPIELRVLVHRPATLPGRVGIPLVDHRSAAAHAQPRVALDMDLHHRDVTLDPGESYALRFKARFLAPGSYDRKDFYVQVNHAEGAQLVQFPGQPFTVVPSLAREAKVEAERIRGYDDGVKYAITVRHIGVTLWSDFEVAALPQDAVIAGVAVRRKDCLQPGDVLTFELVVACEAARLELRATTEGERVSFSYPLTSTAVPMPVDAPPPFAFLEPRSLPIDRINVHRDGTGLEIRQRKGRYPVRGLARYLVEISPREDATGVALHPAAGEVEVEGRPRDSGAWPFLLTVVANPTLTRTVCLYYDVTVVPGRVLRGELYLSVRSNELRLWTIAATAGLAITLRGVAAVAPMLLNPDDPGIDFTAGSSSWITPRWLTVAELLSIPLVRGALWGVDWIWRWYDES